MVSNNVADTLDLIKLQWTQWVEQGIKFKVLNDYNIQVLTSFTDYFGDGIIFNISIDGDNAFSLTDNGYNLWNMKMNGIDLSKKGTTRYRLLQWYLKYFNFSINDQVIHKDDVKLNNLSQSMLDFIQLLLRISDLGATNRANTRGIFFDDAKKFFSQDQNLYFFSTNHIALGKTKQQYVFEYDFTPMLGVDKLTKLYNTLSKNTMEAIIGIYSDTKEYLAMNYRKPSFNVLVNEITNNSKQYVEGLEEHNIQVINFQDKTDVLRVLGKTA